VVAMKICVLAGAAIVLGPIALPRVHQNFKRSLADVEGGAPGGGELARYLIVVGYSIRF